MLRNKKDQLQLPISDEIFSVKTLYNHEDRLNNLENNNKEYNKQFDKLNITLKSVITQPQFEAGLALKVLQ